MAAPKDKPAVKAQPSVKPRTWAGVRLKCLELVTKHGISSIGGVSGAIEAAKKFEAYVTRDV